MSFFLLFFLASCIAVIAGLWKIFQKAGYKGWEVLIPFYNFYIWLKIIRKPLWWYIFIIIPFINVFTILLMVVETAKCFKRFSLLQQGLAGLFPFVYLPYLGFKDNEKYTHPDNLPKFKKTVVREWTDAIIFAVIAATIIRTFLIEAYTIPTSSMEKSLLVGDFLFVSKLSYGPRIPNTPLSFPFAHHTLPLTKTTKSYLEWIKLPYYRFFGLTSIKRNDAVVFNYPDGDTTTLEFQSSRSYYAMCREMGRDFVNRNFTVVSRPVDKRENYIKRCVALPGDTLEIIDQNLYINGVLSVTPGETQFNYVIKTDGTRINPRVLSDLSITDGGQTSLSGEYIYALSEERAEKLRKIRNIVDVVKILKPKNYHEKYIFPYSENYKWNEDNFGPLYIPKAGTTVRLDTTNIVLYERIIHAYEGHDLKIQGDKILIDGRETDSYTFSMDYYWLMGDNRHNSADSRFWGFVPNDHIVGKAVFVWLSLDKDKSLFDGKIRWNKMFRLVN
ncbi:MAG: signal peptidase I [Bacteroidales bacterium]|nr:signal peptidase I [Bacteroidales bacterium]